MANEYESAASIIQGQLPIDWLKLQNSLTKYCLSVTRSSWEADDLIQDTWQKALQRDPSLSHNNVEAWLITIASNAWKDRLRRKQLEQKVSPWMHHDKAYEAGEQDTSLTVASLLSLLMKHLTKQQMAVFLLREVYAYSAKETALMLKLTEGAVKASLLRARSSLLHVRKELVALTWDDPQSEATKMLLHQMALAYQQGDVFQLIALVQMDGMDAETAIITAKGIVNKRSEHVNKAVDLSIESPSCHWFGTAA
ncbi:RNA polymerase sigma factor [Paenibacillus sp. 1001270B_150601_E10]|uniref:RNA polymerase sigma factor n=1 Tax=Paenibacillus sp. 1001270B_150601_E10 TaxID=2787079 RepID=UPI00189EB108|nr:RNA polymerase sigma factor [Paenibacillus sp. 1001270B_150601_E10]